MSHNNITGMLCIRFELIWNSGFLKEGVLINKYRYTDDNNNNNNLIIILIKIRIINWIPPSGRVPETNQYQSQVIIDVLNVT